MSIIRIKKEKNFSVISNKHLKDTRLSLKAKGLLTLLLSKPDDWQVYVNHLTTISTDGKDAHYTALKELIKRGYITKQKVRNLKGRICGTEYTIYENSNLPDTENPDTVIPNREIPELLNTDKTNTEDNKNLTTAILSPQSTFSFDALNLKFDNFAIRKIIAKSLKKKKIAYVTEAVAYANHYTTAHNANTFKIYLFKIIKNGWAEGYVKNKVSKIDVSTINIDKIKSIKVDGRILHIKNYVARDSDGTIIYPSGMITSLISKGKAIPIYKQGTQE